MCEMPHTESKILESDWRGMIEPGKRCGRLREAGAWLLPIFRPCAGLVSAVGFEQGRWGSI
jgi:hypothetical protein